MGAVVKSARAVGTALTKTPYIGDNQFPDDWDVQPLGALLSFQNGYNAEKAAYGRGLPFANVLEVITKGHLNESDIPGRVTVDPDQLQSFLVKPGDVLFNRTSETQAELGLASVYVGDAAIVFGGFVIRGRIKSKKLYATFAGYALRGSVVRDQVVSRGQGAVRANIGQSELGSVLVALPPIQEQIAITQALSDADAFIATLEKLVLKKRLIRQGVMYDLLSGQSRLPGFKKEWCRKRFSELFDFQPTATNSRADLDERGNTYYIHYGDIHTKFHRHLNFQEKQPPKINRQKCRSAALLRNGDWIMADASEDYDGVCKSIEILGLRDGEKAIAGLHTFLLREKTPTFAPGFKGHLGNARELRNQFLRVMTGMKVFGVSKTALRDIYLPVPEWEEQNAIVAILSDMDAEISALEAKHVKACQMKQGLMQALLMGEVRLI